MMARSSKFAAQIVAAAASGLLAVGMMNQLLAQEEGEPAAPAAQREVENRQDDARNQPADDAPPRDNDLNFDDQRRDDQDPPAVPKEADERVEVRRAVIDDDDVSPSDRRSDVEAGVQPIPEDQAQRHQNQGRWGHGCNPCATRRVYYHRCGGCGGCGWGGRGWSSGSPTYQTQRRDDQRAVVGVTIEDHQDGVRVVSVAPNSPAEQAGLQAGDRIVAIDGDEIHDCQAMMSRIRGMNSGHQVSLAIDRDGEQHEFDAQLNSYAQVFGRDGRRIASDVPMPPGDRVAQRGERREVLRPNLDADDQQQRLQQVQQRIDQLERELTSLRQEQADLQSAINARQPQPADDGAAKDAGGADSRVDELTPLDDAPTPARDEPSDNADVDEASPASDVDGVDASPDANDDSNAVPPADTTTPEETPAENNRERLSPSAR